MSTLVAQRCLNHPSREAAARCPQCRRPYCRECVTEHDGRFLCASCLRKSTGPREARGPRLRWLTVPLHLLVGLAVAWTVFEFLGLVLLRTPSQWHEGIPGVSSPADTGPGRR